MDAFITEKDLFEELYIKIRETSERLAEEREKVLDYLQENAGLHFDPDVVQAFFDEFFFEKDAV